ncbi:hypothetical protein GALLN_00336 [Gallionellaceae bacterium]|nr:hypothetical protein GALLN_00336 [Gallionellaceae bacterium]
MKKKTMHSDASKTVHMLDKGACKVCSIMNKILKPILFACLFGPGMAFAAGGEVKITSPDDGGTVTSHDKVRVSYEAVPGSEGDHLHLNVDGKRMDVIRPLRGTTEVEPLAPGKHQICLVVNTKAHVPTGVEKCISVTSK